MDPLGVFILAAIIVIVGLVVTGFLFWGFLHARKRVELIEGARLCTADRLRGGMCKMRGKVGACEDLLSSPLTRTPCVYYSFVVEEQRTRTVSDGKTTRVETYWHPVITDVQSIECALRDKTGEAGVNFKGAELMLQSVAHSQSGTFNNAPRGLERMLQRRYNFSTKGLLFNKNLRYTEYVLEENIRVFVVGQVKVRKSGGPRFVKGTNPLLVTDSNETKLVSHHRTRMTWYLAGSIAVPILTLLLGGGVGLWALVLALGQESGQQAP